MLTAGAADEPAAGDPLAVARAFLKSLNRPGPLVVAVSGGGDSMALLTALHIALEDDAVPARPLIAVTVDHALRAASDEEARWVGRFCAERGIEHHVMRWHGAKPATGIQAAARLARYRLIADVAQRVGAVAVATAHTLDDQAETIAMRAGRAGAAGAIRGLAGMAPATLFARTTWVLRPFLALTRAELRRWLAARAVRWIDDPSNEDDRFERVRVRAAGTAALDAPAIAARSAERRHRAARMAALIAQRAAMHGGALVSFACDPEDGEDCVPDAVATLMALVGGRPYPPGRAVTDRLAGFLRGGPDRMNAARVVAERRRDRLYLYREQRGLPTLRLRPGVPVLYDGRYAMTLAEGQPASIVAPPDGETIAEAVKRPELAGVPPAVMRRALAAEPVIVFGGAKRFLCLGPPAQLKARRHLALFDAFLPLFDITLANGCAALFGREPYAPPPVMD